MTAHGARELTPEEVKVTMVDDPARGWELAGEHATVWLEFPPYHACSVRWNTSEIADLAAYREAVARYRGENSGFLPMKNFDADRGDLHIHATGEHRTLPDGQEETLMIIDQHITDSKKRKAGQTGVVLRFVHQLVRAPTITN